jgi:recombination protein RecA
MAKTKTKTKTKDNKLSVPSYLDKTIKEYGQILKKGTDVLKDKQDLKVISISPAIDVGLGGGVTEGSWITLTGDPKSGKTTTALQIAKNCQDDGRVIIYLDAEGRLKKMNFELAGLDPEKMIIISPEDKPVSAEQFLDIAYKMLSDPEYHGAVLIIDSISSLIPQKEIDADFGSYRAGLPKILSVFTKKVGQLLPSQRGLVIAITHFIANTSGYGQAKMADGGNKIQYQVDTRMEIRGGGGKSAVTAWTDSNGTQIGQIVNWKVLCSSMGPPGGFIESYIRYGHGIDKVKEIMSLGLDLGFVSKRGAWYTLDFMLSTETKVAKWPVGMATNLIEKGLTNEDMTDEELRKAFTTQGEFKLYELLVSNTDIVELLTKLVMEAINE